MNEYMVGTGTWRLSCYNPDGTLDWTDVYTNSMVLVGINNLLSEGMLGRTWYIGLIDSANFEGFDAINDVAGSHPGWTEYAGYSEGTRQTWAPGSAAGGMISNPGAATFTFPSGGTVVGAFLVSSNVKSGTAGILFAEGSSPSPRTMNPGQILKVSYRLSITSN